MRREKKRVLLSLVLICCIFCTSEFNTLAADTQSEARPIETINHEIMISPLAETLEQIPAVAEKVAKQATKEAATEKAEVEEAAKKKAVAAKTEVRKEIKKKTTTEKVTKENTAKKKTAKRLAAKKNEKTESTVSERKLLAALIYCEAGNQPHKGKVAVGAVVINRMKSKSYPNTMKKVIYQRGQFGPAITGKLDRVLRENAVPKACYKAADDALAGENPVGDALYFGCGNYGKKIGDHWFH